MTTVDRLSGTPGSGAAADRLSGVQTSVAIKAPVKAATTANITLSGTQTIDGVALVSGDRVLVKDQSTASENGVYVVATGAWTRALDFNGNSDVAEGTLVSVTSGSTSAGLLYRLSTAAPDIGTSALSFTAVSTLAGGPFQDQNANLTSLAGLTLAADRGLYSTGADTLALFTLTAAGRALLDDADAAAQRTTLGIGRPGLEFIESQDAASSATLDFTGFDDTKYDSYLFVLANIIPATTGDDNLRLRTSTDGGATYDDTLGDYHYSSQMLPMTATPMGGVNGASSATAVTLALNVGGNTDEDGFSGEVSILGPHLAKDTAVQWQGSFLHGTANYQWSSGAGVRAASEAVDAARFFFFDNSIASGTITMYGRSNSA